MSSWRERASVQAQADLDDLLGTALDVAQRSLSERGEFYPFGVATDLDGQGLLMAADPGHLPSEPTSIDVRLQVLAQLVTGAESLRAGGVVVDVSVDGGDAVRVELEHRDGIALVVIAPYRKAGDQVSFGELQAGPGSRTMWIV